MKKLSKAQARSIQALSSELKHKRRDVVAGMRIIVHKSSARSLVACGAVEREYEYGDVPAVHERYEWGEKVREDSIVVLLPRGVELIEAYRVERAAQMVE